MNIAAIDHVQLAMPEGREAEARTFYVGVLGFVEVPKPDVLTSRGGLWLESGAVKLHLGIEKDFRPARKAHPAFRVSDLNGLRTACEQAGFATSDEVPPPGIYRFFVDDPFGNRIEFIFTLPHA